LTQKSTLESIGVDFELFKVKLSCANSGLEFTCQYYNPKSIATNFGIGVIVSGCGFIQTNEPMLKGEKFICTSKKICIVGAKFRHSNFGIKERTILSLSFFFF
jgi:hypothetical protein